MDNITHRTANGPQTPRDLRAELFESLSTQFEAALETDSSLPLAAKSSLVELLKSDTTTADQIIAAASKNDPAEEEAGNE